MQLVSILYYARGFYEFTDWFIQLQRKPQSRSQLPPLHPFTLLSLAIQYLNLTNSKFLAATVPIA